MNKKEIKNQIQQIQDELRIIEPMMQEDDDRDVRDRVKSLYAELNELNEKSDTISPDEEDDREMMMEQEIEDNIHIIKTGGKLYRNKRLVAEIPIKYALRNIIQIAQELYELRRF